MEFTGERFVPEIEGNIALEHLHRYAMARELAKDKLVLDIACGEGYGSAMLAEVANRVVGVDISEEVVEHARRKYKRTNLEFKVGSCSKIPIRNASVDLVVSFETIEHHDQHEAMMSEIKRVLRPNGVLIISSPEKHEYSEIPGHNNQFHVKELYRHEFEELMSSHFKHVAMYGQRVVYGSGILREKKIGDVVSFSQENGSIRVTKGIARPIYLIAVASDGVVPNVASGVFEQPINESEAVRAWIEVVRERERRIATLTQTVDSLIVDRDAQLSGINQLKEAYDKLSAERDEQITSVNKAVAEREAQIATLTQTVGSLIVDRDAQLSGLNQLKDAYDKLSAEREAQIATLTQTVDSLTVDRDAQLSQRDAQILSLNHALAKQDKLVSGILSSTSWRITKPLRFVGRMVRGDWAATKASVRTLFSKKRVVTDQFDSLAKSSGVLLTQNQEGRDDELMRVAINNGDSGTPSKKGKILLVSYYCPTRFHAGGLRVLDLYLLLRKLVGPERLDLYSIKRPEIDKDYKDVEGIFDNIYWARSSNLTLAELTELSAGKVEYEIVDMQFHEAVYDIENFRSIASKTLFTPMELMSRSAGLDIRNGLLSPRTVKMRELAGKLRSAREELLFSKHAHLTVCVSKPDASFLRAITLGRSIDWIESGLSTLEFSKELQADFEPLSSAKKSNSIIYVAFFGSMTNLDALEWYLRSVHPLVKSRVPDYKLSVVGRGDLSQFRKYQDGNLDLVGEVDKLAPYIGLAKAGIAPALGGSGFRGKVNQYAICGVPCVASSIAAKGLGYTNKKEIFVENQPKQFAERCIALLTDNVLNEQIRTNALRYCREMHTWEAKRPDIERVYEIR